jgi:hypothetical protein
MIRYDPRHPPMASGEIFDQAQACGMGIFYVICAPRGGDINSDGAVRFLAAGYSLPRMGEKIVTEDGKVCEVTDIQHCITPLGGTQKRPNALWLLPTVTAVRLTED